MKYFVGLDETNHLTVEVEAESAEKAREIALEKYYDHGANWHGFNLLGIDVNTYVAKEVD